MNKSVALLLVVESSKKNKGDVIGKYGTDIELPYEREAITCVEYWRRNGGEYKDCSIYAVNLNGNPPDVSTINTLKEMDVMYFQDYFPITETFPCGYWNTPFALNYLENRIYETLLIHIDLDMYLMRKPTYKLFDVQEDKICKISINKYRPTDSLDYKISPIYPFEIATNFIVSKRKKQFYSYWWSSLFYLWKTRKHNFDDKTLCIYEERIVDEMYHNGFNFEFFDMDYQLEDDSKVLPFFIHTHMENTRFTKMIQKWFRLKNK